ncbi:AraC family transcriptional regulator [Geobacter sp. AOG2]|uniref:AraC family transcriptional regulator n=1 Tax=Geobacter sp. AOG2 TaxID=1566347 RepID=UPI001CC7D574|nr:AraC family transcriptional regulator [Geobacter sp. AOG2]GFE62652.1 AraC family transcriptional regulator [Geobacter sp. AOG2]
METAQTAKKGRLAVLLERLATREGFTRSNMEGVTFIRANKSYPRAPVTYDPSIVIVAQGRKRGYLGEQVFTYDPCNYLVLSVPLPFECETEATPQEPLLAVSLKVDPTTLSELLMVMDDESAAHGAVPRGIYSTPLTDDLICAAIRLLECLESPLDSRILGPQIMREITYRVLCGEQGGALRAVAIRHGRFSQIARVLRKIHTDYGNGMDIESLASEANMSVSTFHHTFKAVTSASPLQYLKSIRLHKARLLMVQDGLNASTAAGRVGYESASQFSREFKRFFGNSPVDEAEKIRAMAD